ncbi:helix-turn-helix domain-containing protein [Chitinophaga qingshengii]|uniref:Helix-turn-helix transcriptional regulator n=1 Tax=Chitinophaga qingshengii TaxID=1569794 RepID=A0ABR7TPQ6_9BACT|nr:AraC family transcriptional regulator [Chitinophaga qingshengii]MBC9931558.1 helix-turn-helix transcriptional regulator [Chitinophaga qingshengii]
MEAIIQHIYQSPICEVHNFLCQCQDCNVSAREHHDKFSIAFIRQGNFIYKVFRNDLDAFHGLFLISKPGYEHRVGHVHDMPDQCTIFSFPAANTEHLEAQGEELAWFLKNPDLHALLIKATPEMEYLHHRIFNLLQQPHFPRLCAEQLMLELFSLVLSGGQQKMITPLTDRQKRHHLPLISTVKTFISENISEDISLPQLADISHLSPFHFNRLFKQMTGITPYNYLLQVRLKEAHLQLRHSRQSITHVAFETGFNSLEHFSAAYKKQYGLSPSQSRR